MSYQGRDVYHVIGGLENDLSPIHIIRRDKSHSRNNNDKDKVMGRH